MKQPRSQGLSSSRPLEWESSGRKTERPWEQGFWWSIRITLGEQVQYIYLLARLYFIFCSCTGTTLTVDIDYDLIIIIAMWMKADLQADNVWKVHSFLTADPTKQNLQNSVNNTGKKTTVYIIKFSPTSYKLTIFIEIAKIFVINKAPSCPSPNTIHAYTVTLYMHEPETFQNVS